MRTIKGFTLIEMIIVLVISGLIMAAASIMLSAGFSNYFTGVKMSTLSNQATLVMARMTKELQQAAKISALSPTSMTFTTTEGSPITYNWSNPTLTRTGTAGQPFTLSNQVTNFSLSYYQSNFTATTILASVRAITIIMTLSNGSESIPLINTIFLSNMV